MKIEIGKFYRTANGLRVWVFAKYARPGYPYKAHILGNTNATHYDENGRNRNYFTGWDIVDYDYSLK